MTWPVEVSVWFILALIGLIPTFAMLGHAFEKNKGWMVAVGYLIYCILMFPLSFWMTN